MTKTIYEKYGGFAAVSKIVLDLYDRLLEDDEVGPFFEEIDMTRIIDHQTKFLSSLMGGPASYTDDQIQRTHSRLAIRNEHFDMVRSILRETLTDHGVADDDADAIVGAFEARRGLVVD